MNATLTAQAVDLLGVRHGVGATKTTKQLVEGCKLRVEAPAGCQDYVGWALALRFHLNGRQAVLRMIRSIKITGQGREVEIVGEAINA